MTCVLFNYILVVSQEGNVFFSLFKGVFWTLVPGNVVNPVRFVVVSAKTGEPV